MAFYRNTGGNADRSIPVAVPVATGISEEFNITIHTYHDANRETNRVLRVRANDTLERLIAQISEGGRMRSIDFAGQNLLREPNKRQTVHDIGIGPGSILDVMPEEVFRGGSSKWNTAL